MSDIYVKLKQINNLQNYMKSLPFSTAFVFTTSAW